MKNKYNSVYMKMAIEWSKLSSSKRKQVGCLIVKNKTIISDGYNGTPSGSDNNCEDEKGVTKWEVLHAEANAITKLSKSTNSSKNATLYTTLSPCKECSKLILQAGIKKVYYLYDYRDNEGLLFLKKQGLKVIKIELDN